MPDLLGCVLVVESTKHYDFPCIRTKHPKGFDRTKASMYFNHASRIWVHLFRRGIRNLTKYRYSSSTGTGSRRNLIRIAMTGGFLPVIIASRYRGNIIHCDSPTPLVLHAPIVKPTSSTSVVATIGKVSQELIREMIYYATLLARFLYIWLRLSPALLTAPINLLGNDDLCIWWSQLLRSCIEVCGPCSIKFAQWIATRPDLFPLHICHTLEGLQSRSHVQTKAEILQSLQQALGAQWRQILSLDDQHLCVLGSGCVAEVIQASFHNQQVAVKLVHPGVKETILLDLALLRSLARVVELVPGAPNMSLLEIVEEFSASMLAQLDMNREAQALATFRQNFRGSAWSRLSFPKVLLSTETVLVETLEEGVLLSTVLRRDLASAAQLKEMARIGLDAFLKMIFEDNYVHADLHPGNIIVRFSKASNGFQMSFIDTGLIVQLRPEDRRNFIDLFTAIVFNDGKAVGRLMIDRSRGKDCRDREGFERAIAEIVNDVHSHGLNLKRISVGKLLETILVLCYTHQVKLESRFANLLLAIGILEGLGRRLDPDVDLIRRAAPFINPFSL